MKPKNHKKSHKKIKAFTQFKISQRVTSVKGYKHNGRNRKARTKQKITINGLVTAKKRRPHLAVSSKRKFIKTFKKRKPEHSKQKKTKENRDLNENAN